MGRTDIHHGHNPRPSRAQCRRNIRHNALNMNYPGFNLSDVRHVFSDPRQRQGPKPDPFQSSINGRTQTMADPRLQPLPNVPSWQGGEPQPARGAWNNANPTYDNLCLPTDSRYQGLLSTVHSMIPLSRSSWPRTQLSA